MKTFLYGLTVVMLLVLLPGCSGEKDKNLNSPDKRRDLPRSAPTENDK
jgi:hypothetical protein